MCERERERFQNYLKKKKMENVEWYYNAGGDDSEGPVDVDELKRLYKAAYRR